MNPTDVANHCQCSARSRNLSATDIEWLPDRGIEHLTHFYIKNVENLWKIPVVSFKNLQKAEVTYHYHCCLIDAAYYDGSIGRGPSEMSNSFPTLRPCTNTTSSTTATPTIKPSTGRWPPNSNLSPLTNKTNNAKLPNDTCFHPNDQTVTLPSATPVTCTPRSDAFNPCDDLLGIEDSFSQSTYPEPWMFWAMFTLGAHTPFFFKDPTQYKAETLYSGTKVCVYILGTQCLNTALFCASAQALVRGYQLRTWPYAHSRKSQINPLISSGMRVRHRRVWVRDCLSPTVLCVWLLLFSSGHDTFRVLSLKVFTWSDCGNTRNSPKDQILTKPNRDGKDWRGLYASLRSCSLHRKWPRLEPTKLISSNLSGSTCRLFTDVPRAFQALLTNLETFWDSNKVAFPRFQKRASCYHVHQRFPQTNDVFLISCQVPMFFASLLGW